MNDTLKWLLIGLGAYLLYEQYVAAPALATTTTGTTPAPAPTPSQAALPAASAPAMPAAQQQAVTNLNTLTSAPAIQSVIQSLASKDANMVNGNLSQWQWNVYTTQATGVSGIADLGTGSTAIPFSQYWTALINWATAAANSPTGMAGLRGLSGLRGASAGLNSQQKKKLPLIAQTYDMQETSW